LPRNKVPYDIVYPLIKYAHFLSRFTTKLPLGRFSLLTIQR
jgi:hypothetical protein